MRYILLTYQNTNATPERAEEIAARWPDAQHGGMEIRALTHGGGEEG
jgi:hypothetical protein